MPKIEEHTGRTRALPATALLLAPLLCALVGGAASASEGAGGIEPSKSGEHPPPVADAVEGSVSNTERASLSTAASTPQWNMGPFSQTYYFNPTFGTTEVLTRSYPRVGAEPSAGFAVRPEPVRPQRSQALALRTFYKQHPRCYIRCMRARDYKVQKSDSRL